MKVRQGFVSNSSSSSFILSLPNEERKVTVTVETMLGGDFIRTEEELLKFAKDRWWINEEGEFTEPEYYEEKYNKLLEKIREGRVILDLTVSYHNEHLNEILGSDSFYEDNDIELIEGGY